MLKSHYSEQPGQFLEQLLIVSDLRLRIYNCDCTSFFLLACTGENNPAPFSIKCVAAGFPLFSFSKPGVSVSGG